MKAKKVVLVGEMSVGKTCIIDRFCRENIDPEVKPTVGAMYSTAKFECDGAEATFLIWDTAGQDRYRQVAPMYYRGASAVIIVYAIDCERSFGEIDFWVRSVRAGLGKVQIVIVGNKSDLRNERIIDVATGQAKADEHCAMFFETSALTGAFIRDLFVDLARALVDADTATREPKATQIDAAADSEGTCC
jgi:small GTP-binding protein